LLGLVRSTSPVARTGRQSLRTVEDGAAHCRTNRGDTWTPGEPDSSGKKSSPGATEKGDSRDNPVPALVDGKWEIEEGIRSAGKGAAD
jgi:hypothetical protein